MVHKDLNFYVNQLIINNRPASMAVLENIGEDSVQKEEIKHPNGKTQILFIRKIEKSLDSGRFLNIYFLEGGRYPYAEKVVDTAHSLTEIENPRSADEFELNSQLFISIDLEHSRIFLSNQKRKTEIIEWFKKEIGMPVSIKPLLREEDFMKKIKSIDEISFTIEPDASGESDGSSLAKQLSKDIFGFEAEKATLILKYRQKKVSDRLMTEINSLLNKKSEYKNVTITGRASDGFENVFNSEGVTAALTVSVPVSEETKKMDPVEVFSLLKIAIIKDENNNNGKSSSRHPKKPSLLR